MREHFPWWANKFNVAISEWGNEHEFDRSYLSAVLQEGTNGTHVFSMRLMWESVAGLTERLGDLFPDPESDSARFQSAFGPLHYLYLSRKDKVEQAVSLLKAEQSGLWHVNADGTERERLKPEQTTAYDSVLLSEFVATLKEHDLAWKRWFFEQGIDPVCVTYESLASKPQAVLGNVLSTLGIDPSIARGVEPVTTKLADSESSDWATRFRIKS